MASYNGSEDEFDRLEDDLDYSAIGDDEWQALNSQATPSHPSQGGSGHLRGDPGPSTARSSDTVANNDTDSAPVTRRSSSTGSSAYFSEDDDLDSSFLEQLDRVEREALGTVTTTRSSQPQSHQVQTPIGLGNIRSDANVLDPHTHPRHHNSNNGLEHLKPQPLAAVSTSKQTVSSPKRPRSCSASSSDDTLSNKKGKTKGSGDLEALLEGFQEEMTCPICFDILVGSSVLNPCGHTLCGPCGYTWITLKKQTTCPVCRTKCCHYKPLVPNIMVDNIIERHIEILAARGDKDWSTGGAKWNEWHERLEKWKKNVNFTRGVQRRVPVHILPTEPPSNVVDPDILFGYRAVQSGNDYGPRSIFDIFAA